MKPRQAPIGAYGFHVTASENTQSICQQGIRPDAETHVDTQDIIDVLHEKKLAHKIPYNRGDAVYMYAEPEFPINNVRDSVLGNSEESAVIVDIDAVDGDVFVGSHSIITDLIDYICVGPRAMMYGETVRESVEAYVETGEWVSSSAELSEALSDRDTRHVELCVPGGVRPEAIAGVIETQGDQDVAYRKI